jgi:hypothetical protein
MLARALVLWCAPHSATPPSASSWRQQNVNSHSITTHKHWGVPCPRVCSSPERERESEQHTYVRQARDNHHNSKTQGTCVCSHSQHNFLHPAACHEGAPILVSSSR